MQETFVCNYVFINLQGKYDGTKIHDSKMKFNYLDFKGNLTSFNRNSVVILLCNQNYSLRELLKRQEDI